MITNFMSSAESLERAIELFSTHLSGGFVTRLSSFNNLIYQVEKSNDFYILRLSSAQHRDELQLSRELDVLLTLANSRLPVSPPLLSCNSKWIETIKVQDETICVSCFKKAPGRHLMISTVNEWDPKLFFNIGAFLGKMHVELRQLHGTQQFGKCRGFFDFYETPVDSFLLDQDVMDGTRSLRRWLEQLPELEPRFGLIHGDFHFGNFIVEADDIHVFDFDSISRHWVDYDIAVMFSHMGWRVEPDVANRYLIELLQGYRSWSTYLIEWVPDIPQFVRLRDLERLHIMDQNNTLGADLEKMPEWVIRIKDYVSSGRTAVPFNISKVQHELGR